MIKATLGYILEKIADFSLKQRQQESADVFTVQGEKRKRQKSKLPFKNWNAIETLSDYHKSLVSLWIANFFDRNIEGSPLHSVKAGSSEVNVHK